MRVFKALPILVFAVSACTVPTGTTTGPAANTPVAPVTWKEGTPRATRNYDITECELGGRGLDFSATEEQLAAATASVPQAQVATFVKRCLAARGYTQTELPVCTSSQVEQGTLQQLPEFLPPLSSVKCVVVGRGFVV